MLLKVATTLVDLLLIDLKPHLSYARTVILYISHINWYYVYH